MTLVGLILSVDLLLGIDSRPILEGLGLMLLMLACMSVPNNFGKEENQP